MGYLFRIILEYKNGFLTKKIRFFDKNFERLQLSIPNPVREKQFLVWTFSFKLPLRVWHLASILQVWDSLTAVLV